jgi:hypothetical protein
LWNHRWARLTALCAGAVVLVVLIIWGIRLAHSSSGSSSPSTTSVSQATSRQGTTASTVVVPLTAAQLAQYKGYAAGMQQANVTATKSFVGAGSTPTQSQLAQVVSAYGAAVNLYDFQLRFIQWPASMQAAITVDHAQLESLVSYLKTFPTLSPKSMNNFLSGLRNRGASSQAADNQVRHNLGLHASSSFP